jgi:hypothetical protein
MVRSCQNLNFEPKSLPYRKNRDNINNQIRYGGLWMDLGRLGVCSKLLSLYGEVFILGDFNVDLLDPGHVLAFF